MRRGFTLVELLVVIGIIAVLISILLPSLNKAREAGNQVKCLANMRSISQAFISFTNDHKGLMPGRAGTGGTKYNPGGTIVNGGATNGPIENADWICWQRKIDPIDGVANGGATDGNISYSSVAPYLGVKAIDTTGDFARANITAEKLQELFRCPSDDLRMRPNMVTGGQGAYRYSYAANDWYMNPIQNTFAAGFAKEDRYGGTKFTGKITSVKTPAEKVMLVCTDELTLSDGIFKASPANWAAGMCNMVSSRHEKKVVSAASNANPAALNKDARGNVSFVDGHAEFFSRKDALRLLGARGLQVASVNEIAAGAKSKKSGGGTAAAGSGRPMAWRLAAIVWLAASGR